MGNIISILFKIFPLLVFVLLEILGIALLTQSNEYYNANIFNQLNFLSGKFHKNVSEFQSYIGLRDINASLVEQNTHLLKENYKLKEMLESQLDTISAKMFEKQQMLNGYEVLAAKVVYNTISKTRNYFIIDKGRLDGIEEDIGIMSEDGPVGFVVSVSDHYATCMSLLNKDANLSARVRGTNHIGIVKWTGPDVTSASLEDLPKHVQLKPGMIVETSGHSTYFPEGIEIAKVVSQKVSIEKNFSIVNLKLNSDFSSLKYVYLLKGNQNIELKSIIHNLDSIDKHNKETDGD